MEQRALAGSRCANHRETLAGLHRQINAKQHGYIEWSGAIRFLEPSTFEHRRWLLAIGSTAQRNARTRWATHNAAPPPDLLWPPASWDTASRAGPGPARSAQSA